MLEFKLLVESEVWMNLSPVCDGGLAWVTICLIQSHFIVTSKPTKTMDHIEVTVKLTAKNIKFDGRLWLKEAVSRPKSYNGGRPIMAISASKITKGWCFSNMVYLASHRI